MKPILIALAAAALAAPALAQTPPPPQAPPAKGALRVADKNGDGALDKSEWLAAGRRERGFAMLDADNDGKLTRAEIRAGRERLAARRAPATP
jgi:hypothetical protein